MPAKRITFLVTLGMIFSLTLPSHILAALPTPIPNFEPDTNVNQNLVVSPSQGMGQCWSVSSEILAKDFVNWAYDVGYSWRLIEPQEGIYDFSYYEDSLGRVAPTNKGYLLYFLTGGADEKGEFNPPWLINKIKANHPQNWIESAHLIAPWDPDWQAALEKLARALAEKYDTNPYVIGIVIPSGCRFGEMSCWPKNDTEKQQWLNAGYTDEKFTQAVEQTVDTFLKYFQNKPVVVQIGGGLNGQRQNTGYKLMAEMFAKYGLRVGYKFNGWGSTNVANIGDYFRAYGGYTAVGYEVGYQNDFSSPTRARELFDEALKKQHVTFGCLGLDLLRQTGAWENEWRYFSRYSGAQILLTSASFSPAQVEAGGNVGVNTSFLNRGTKPLVAPKRNGVKDEPASYSLAIYFVHKQSGQFTKRFLTPSVPTNEWYGGQGQLARSINGTVKVPASGGQYIVRVALENPHAGPHQGERWPLVTNLSHNLNYLYQLGEITVTGGEPPPPGVSLGQGRNVILWNQPELAIVDLWQRFPGTIWISRMISGLWQTVVKEFGREIGNVQTNTTLTITKAYPSNT